MPTLNISSQTSLLNPVNNLVFALYDASAPAVLLESIAPPKPYGNPLQVTFTYNCINGHVYIFQLWESADTTPTGAVRNSTNVTVSGNTVNVRTDEYLEVDVTTNLVSGTTIFEKADYENWELSIERIGLGTMTPDSAADITQPQYKRTNSDDTPNDLGPKITLLTWEDIFQPSERFVVRFIPQVIVAPPPATPSGLFGEGRVITADETLTTADLNKASYLQSATSTLNITLPALSLVSDYSFMYFFSAGGNHINVSLIAPGADKILYPTDKSSLVLGQCETAVLFKANSKWNVLTDLQGVKQVGELLYNYGQTELNALFCNGQELLRAEYPRLWAYVQTLAGGCVVTDAAWSGTYVTHNGNNVYTKKSCFSSGDGATTFRLPLLTNAFLRGVDGSSRIPGSVQLDQVGQFTDNIPFPKGHSYTGAPNSTLFGNGGNSPQNIPISITANAGDKNIVENSGAYLLIRI